ncbi:MAG: hypothetical protein JW937_00505 [Candidatus Omnitrophica bacterium]|nr:hypothetical protein [Candidatus Omnitrophota bacterium]
MKKYRKQDPSQYVWADMQSEDPVLDREELELFEAAMKHNYEFRELGGKGFGDVPSFFSIQPEASGSGKSGLYGNRRN